MAEIEDLKKKTKNEGKDKEKIRENYTIKEQTAATTSEHVELAGLVANNLQDTFWVKRLYEKAADKVKSISDLREIARSIPADLDSKEFAEDIYLRVLERTRSKEEYIMYAQLMAIFLKDSAFSQKLCGSIEAIFLPKRTLEEHYKQFIKNIDGLTAQQKMAQFAEFLKTYKMNKHMKDIYFKLAKEFAQINKREALIAYLKYFQLSFREESQPEPIPDRVKRTIFKNEPEYEAFLEVIAALRRDNDIGAALAKLDERYRKRIELNDTRIASIKSRHAVTVDKLSELLDESGEETDVKKEKEEKTKNNEESTAAVWNPIQEEFLRLFAQNDYVLSKKESVGFARSKNQFESQLITGINELFLTAYDDILIEEEEDKYTINPEYKDNFLHWGIGK